MNIDNKHLATLNSVATHIYVDGGRILFSAQLDEGDIKYVDSHNQFLIDGEIDDEWLDSLSNEDRETFHNYRLLQLLQKKDITNIDVLRTFTPQQIIKNKLNLN